MTPRAAASAALVALEVLSVASCAPARPASDVSAAKTPKAPALAFLEGRIRPLPGAGGADVTVTDPERGRVAAYDAALTALVFMRTGRRERAARLLVGLAEVQREDGALPFSFVLPAPEPDRFFVRSGAVAWAGYAAAEYLDAAPGGPARDEIIALAHRAAAYLLAHQVEAGADPRAGLVTAGFGTIRNELVSGKLRERFIPGEARWTAVEHNVDAWFFLARLAKVTGDARYRSAAERIAQALAERTWSAAEGQLVRGVGEDGVDDVTALDCASWGSVFLAASGDRTRAETAAVVADGRYASVDPRSGAHGHVPHARGPLLEDPVLARHFASVLPAKDWEHLDAVWPEGSAGVALALLRTGHVRRARSILDDLEALRRDDGSLPTFTAEIPFELDTLPSIAGTAWVELVRFELARPPGAPTLLVP